MIWQKEHPAGEKAKPPAWLLGFFLVTITVMAYQPVWHAGFIWDDDEFLTDNPVIKSANALHRLWFTASTPDYFPMTSSMLWVEWRLWGNHPLGYHLVNVLLHAFSAVLLWRVLQRLKIPGALLAAAIFTLHPVNVESVAWITERKNTLCLFFYAGAILSWLKFEDSGQSRWYGLALASFVLALLSKTAVAPLPLVLLGMAWWRRGCVEWKEVRRVVPFFMISVVLALVTVWFQYHRAISHDVVRTDGFWSRLAGAGWAVWFYLYKAVLPLNLVFVYPRWQIDARNILSYIPLVMLAVALVVCWRSRSGRGRALFFGMAYFVVMLLPILGFLNIYFMRFSLVADHWEYFAIIGPIALAAATIRSPVLAATLLVTLGVLTWRQCGMYANVETLWQTTVRLNPECWLAHHNLGVVLDQKGRLNEAITHYREALQIKPDYAEAHYSLGTALVQNGRLDEGITHYQKALRINPGYADAYTGLGVALQHKGRVDEAITHYQKALQIDPDFAEAHYNLAIALREKGRVDEAISYFQKALEINPDYAEAHNNLGYDLLQKEKVDEAITHFQSALHIKPGLPEVHYNLALALRQKGRADEAIAQYRKALEIRPDYSEAHNDLAVLLDARGEHDEAVLHLLAALKGRPQYDQAYYNLGLIYLHQDRLDDAIVQFRSAIAVNPRYDKAFANLGMALGRQGHLDQAIDQYRQALAIAPNNAYAHNAMGRALETGNKLTEAAAQYSAAIASKPDFAEAHFNLALVLSQLGQTADAIQHYRIALDLATAAGQKDLAEKIQTRLRLYQSGDAFHEPARP